MSAYPVLKDQDIIRLRVDKLAERDAMLFMWCTWPKIEIGLHAMRAWGFKYVTAPHVWVKTNADGSPYHGIGFWAVGGSEFVLMGRRGKGIKRNPDTRGKVKQIITAPRTKHSAKPWTRGKILSLLEGDPTRIELFARERAEGWDATGFDLDGRDIREFIEETTKKRKV